LLAIASIAPLSVPRAHADLGTLMWLNQSYVGNDPFFNGNVNAYTAGSTATLNIPVTYSNPYGGAYINVTAATLKMDWNGNYTNTGSVSPANPMRINQNSQGTIQLTFTVPDTGTASNLRTHNSISFTVNYTTPASAGTKQFNGFFVPALAVYTPEQASGMAIYQQLGLSNIGFSGIPTLCGAFGSQAFKTEQGNALCQQALQHANIAIAQYKAANFVGANTSFKAAQTDWNQALQAESSDAGTQSIATMTSGWGTLLLGIGGLLVGVAATIYAFKRPSGMRSSTTSTPPASVALPK
ncbi:MAG TPA: hypothetical protein VE177_00235, partial [Candidatus Binatus sp.]|nr:hypothetical protein [Candidatus Binatus sp.]